MIEFEHLLIVHSKRVIGAIEYLLAWYVSGFMRVEKVQGRE